MREDLRKPVYGSLYYGTKAVCILICGLVCLMGFFCAYLLWSLIKDPVPEIKYLPERTVLLIVLIAELAVLLFFVWKTFPLIWNFKRVSPDETKNIASILGVSVWCYAEYVSNSLTLDWLAEELRAMGLLPFFIFLIFPILIGWGTYRVVNHVLSIIGQRLQACDPKPDNPAGPGEAPQGERETV